MILPQEFLNILAVFWIYLLNVLNVFCGFKCYRLGYHAVIVVITSY